MKTRLIVAMILFIALKSTAQFKIDGEFRPRTEFRHGFGTLIAKDQDPGYGISTRARLNFGFEKDNYSFYVSIQDVLIWGENMQIHPQDLNNSFALFQVWAKFKFSETWDTKIGRQVISYDDQRILGGLDWAQQGRNHDAILVRHKKAGFKLDLAFAYNQDHGNISGFQNVGNAYNTSGFFSYKTMLYGYGKKQWDHFSLSLLLMNNGFQNFEEDGTTPDGISNLQTFGTHLNYKKNRFSAEGNLFFQTGERQGGVKVNSAFLTGLDAFYGVTKKTKIGLGIELISGNDSDPGETGAFFPLYGTNHKFNGFMDYFYVGNHANSVGLLDIHASANFNFSEKSGLFVKLLNFSGEKALPSGEKSLGTEIDFVYTQKFKGFAIKGGYSHMFPADGMYELKGISKEDASDIQNWAWVMLILKPKLLN